MRAKTAAGSTCRSASQRTPAPGAGPDWAGAFFNGNAGFHKGFATTSGGRKSTRFISFSDAPCAKVYADATYYCESLDMPPQRGRCKGWDIGAGDGGSI